MANQKDSSLQETPTLYYAEIRGIAQPLRNLFYYLDAKFCQIYVQNSKQLDAGFNSGFPKLVQGSFELTNAITIFRHICRLYNRQDLLGLTPQNKATINQFLFHYPQMRSRTLKKILEGARIAWKKQSEGQKYQIKIATLKIIVEQQCKILKDFLQLYMKSKGWLLSYMTIIDFFFYEICYYLVNFFGSTMKNSIIYRNFINFADYFENQDFFLKNKQLITSRKMFMPFKDKQNYDIMRLFWQGDVDKLA